MFDVTWPPTFNPAEPRKNSITHSTYSITHIAFVNRIGRNIPSFLKVRLRYASKAMLVTFS